MSQCLQSSESGNLQEPCIPHEKEHKLFCIDCNKAFCGACMDQGKHDFHQICTLASVYNEKISVVKDKLKQLEKYQDEWSAGSSAYERNLRLLEKAETFLRNDITEIITHAEQDLANMTNDRKKVLLKKLEQTTKNTKMLTDLNSKVDQLSMNQFLQQFAEIDLQCDELIGAPEPVTLQSVDDIHCRLIPPYQFEQVIYPGFFKAKHNDEHNVMIKSARDVEWELTVNKSDLIRISLRATDSQVATFRHALTIVIPHPDYTKEIRQTFNMDTGGHTFNVLIMHKISEHEFCNPGGDLVMKIGIRPLNSLVEKQLAIYQYVQLKEANEKLTKRLTYFTDEYDYKHLTMYFNIELEQFKRYRFLKSYGICDGENREWRMTMKLNSKNMIATHIQLIRGAGTECRFFIELEHMNLQKSIRKSSICKKFDFGNGTKPMWGFKFIEFDELKADAGFLRNDLLHFRFGVRPLLSTTVVYDDSRTLTKSATTSAEPNVPRTSWKSRSGRKLVRKAAAKTHAKLNVDPLLQAKEAIDDGSTSLETGNGSAILKSGGDRKETAEETQPKQNVRSLSPDTGKLKWYQKLLPGNSQTSARQRVRPLSPASESDDDRQTVRQTAVMTPAEPYVALYSPASEVFGGGRSLSMSSGGRTLARQTAAMTPVEPSVRPLSPAADSDDDCQTVRQTAAMTPAEPYAALYSPASEVFGGGRSLSMSSGGRTHARQTAASTVVEPTVRQLSPATEYDGDRQTVRQTAAMTPAEPNEGTSNPAKEKHVSFVE